MKKDIERKEFDEYLKSIGGLVNGYFKDRPNITSSYICECSSKWLPLIKNLIKELIELGWNKEIYQIKEKFGGLRFYINEGSKEIFNTINKYEELSYHTCESCGVTEDVESKGPGWITTLCKNCREKTKKG